jgi:hypothetical protein
MNAIRDVIDADAKDDPSSPPVTIPFRDGTKRKGYRGTFHCGLELELNHHAYFVLPEAGVDSIFKACSDMRDRALLKRATGLELRSLERAAEDAKAPGLITLVSNIYMDQLMIDPSVYFPKTVQLLRDVWEMAHKQGSVFLLMENYRVLDHWLIECGHKPPVSGESAEIISSFWIICQALGIKVPDDWKARLTESVVK